MVSRTKVSSSTQWQFEAIGYVESCYTGTFGIPRQSGLAPSAEARVRMVPPYNDPDALEGLVDVSHLWIQFVFHKQKSKKKWSPKVRPPRLGGNKAIGVFATRSPNRPNPIGLSLVKFEGVEREGAQLYIKVSGVDILDGSPVLDIKPYLPYADRLQGASNRLADAAPPKVEVIFTELALSYLNSLSTAQANHLRTLVIETLRNDPRPQYHRSDKNGREYAMRLFDLDIRWKYAVCGNQTESIQVCSLTSATGE